MDTQSIVILDFGSQYTQLIARRIREQNVFSAVLPCTAALSEIQAYSPIGIILSGGPCSVYDADAPNADPAILALGLPVLGICYGLQFIAHHLGGKVRSAEKREYGHAEVTVEDSETPLFEGLPAKLQVWMSHGDEALELPEGFHRTAVTSNALAGIADEERKIWAVQFHPEVHHTPLGSQLLRNFVFGICGARGDWTAAHFIESTVTSIREKVGSGHVICALSGGVDSSVAAVLVHRAIGEQLTCVFVNNGVLRKNEFTQVTKNLRDKLGLNLVPVDASERFLAKLAGVTDPETKRKQIGREFIAVFDDEATRIAEKTGGVDWLVQGTLYPDVIESSSVRGPSQTIKSHHNVGGLPETMKMKLIEPLRDLFKDEVRRIGRDLGMPEDILGRQPFPGPGLAVRILGEVTAERVAILQEADDIVVGEIKAAGLYSKVWQSFAVLLPVRSVGVMGDQRTYANTCAVRAVHSEDGMTADWVPLPYEVLKKISSRIVNEVRGINRVVYDITSKPPAPLSGSSWMPAGQVIISHPTGNTFSSAVVEALYEEQLLAAFFTCIVWRPDSMLGKLVPAGIRTTIERRARVQLPPQMTRTRPMREVVRNLFIRAGKKHLIAAESNPFSLPGVYRDLDAYVARSLDKFPDLKALYAYEDGALIQFRKAQGTGVRRIYDLPIGYWRANRKISIEEAELQPEWKGTLNALTDSDQKCALKDEEISLADTVIVPSTFVKNTLDLYPRPLNVVVNPFGVPLNLSAPRQLTDPNQPLRVLYVGSLTQRKGISYLFKAVENAGKAVVLTVIGRKVGHSRLLDQHCQAHRWISSLPHTEILAEMSRHDVFVFPSLFEGLALVQGEAISQGLPVITTPNSGGTDILRDGVDGFIVPIRDPDAITERLLQLNADRALLLRMSDSARQQAATLTWLGYKARALATIRRTTNATKVSKESLNSIAK